MNSPWVKLLLVALLFTAIGFFVGRHGGMCCGVNGCGDRGSCHAKAGCDHADAKGGSCCKGGHGEAHGSCKGGHADEHGGGKSCCKGGDAHDRGHGHGDAHVHTIIDGLKSSNFQGDTTITIDGGTVNVKRTGDQMEVKVEMSDSVRMVEKTVTAP
jgi:hypothetical protein